MIYKFKNIFLIIFITILLIYLIFYIDIDITHSRFFQELWNAGHVVLFIFISWLLYRKYFYINSKSFYFELFSIVLIALIIGILIELIQTYTGRNKSLYDVGLDVLGGLIGISIFSKTLHKHRKFKIYTFNFMTFLSASLLLYPMALNMIDDIYQSKEFPFILSNKYSRELLRFNKKNINVDFVRNDFSVNGNDNIFKLKFFPGKFSTAELTTGVENWVGYNYLFFRIFNPNSASKTLAIRIDDSVHKKSGYLYSDRYNKRLIIHPGWNEIKINLDEIKNAPLDRKMIMEKIDQILLFKSNLNKTLVLYLDQMVLIK